MSLILCPFVTFSSRYPLSYHDVGLNWRNITEHRAAAEHLVVLRKAIDAIAVYWVKWICYLNVRSLLSVP